MTNMMLRPVLVLNATYEPINITPARRALGLIIKGAALVEVSRDIKVHKDLELPSVVRLREYRRVPHSTMVMSHRNLYLRDNHTCQYCGVKFPASELTLDHVVPRCQGGTSKWENLVVACGPCNHRKNDRTPEEAGMPLLRQPRAMTIHTSRAMMRESGHDEESWKKYLYF